MLLQIYHEGGPEKEKEESQIMTRREPVYVRGFLPEPAPLFPDDYCKENGSQEYKRGDTRFAI